MKHLLLTITLAVLLFSCCKKKTDTDTTPTLPPATQEGKNTFGCKVDGSIITANGKPINWNDPDYVDFSEGTDSISIITSKNPNPKWYMQLHFIAYQKTGTFILKYIEHSYGYYLDLSNTDFSNGNNVYTTDNINNTGTLNITRNDTKVIAGTFEMNVANDSGKIVHITDGRFDITK